MKNKSSYSELTTVYKKDEIEIKSQSFIHPDAFMKVNEKVVNASVTGWHYILFFNGIFRLNYSLGFARNEPALSEADCNAKAIRQLLEDFKQPAQ